MVKLDLSKMKHVKSDDKTTTLQHPAGHMITLAHKALSPEARIQVQALAKGGKPCYDEGGKVPAPTSQTDSTQSSPKTEHVTPSNVNGPSSASDAWNRVMSGITSSSNYADGGRVKAAFGVDTSGGKVPVPGPAREETPNPYDKTEVSRGTQTGETHSVGEAIHNALSNWWDAQKKAEGGEIKEQNPKLEQSEQIPQKSPGNTLNYHQLRKEYREKSKTMASAPQKRKMYADHEDEVGQNDTAPEMQDIGGVGKAADHYREAARLAEKAGDAAQGSSAPSSLMLKPGMPGADETRSESTPAPKPHIKHAANPIAAKPSDELSLDQADDNESGEEPDHSGSDTVPAASDTVSDQGDEALDTDETVPQGEESVPMAGAAPSGSQPAANGQTTTPAANGAQQPAANPNAQQYPAQQAQPMDYGGYANDVRNKMIKEDQAFQHDLNNGHITPETYHDLFAKKDTLGKISSLFGLMVSGIGSGLSHQPNMVMQMMDREIQNDLDAQKTSKSNAYNLHSLNQQRLAQESQIALAQKQGTLTQAQAETLRKDAAIKGNTLDQIMARRLALHKLAVEVDKLPEGKEKADKQAVLTLLTQQTNNENFNLLDQAAQQSATLHYGNTPSQTPNPEADFRNKVKSLRNSGNEARAADLEAHHIPGMPGQTTVAMTPEALKKLQGHELLDNKVNDVLDFAKKYATFKGNVSPSVIKEGAAKANELVAFYNGTVDNLGMTKGRLDWLENQIKSNPQSIAQQVLGNNATLNEIRKSNKQREQLFLTGTGGLGYTENGERSPAESKLDPKNQALVDWARKNPNDPRSTMVLKKLGIGQ